MDKNKSLEEGKLYCATCNKEMKLVLLKHYAFEEGLSLSNVPTYRCPECHELFFTEQQAKAMEARTEELKERTFGFKRKVTISGKSLVLGIPSELVEHLRLKQGMTVKILPLAKNGFLVKKV